MATRARGTIAAASLPRPAGAGGAPACGTAAVRSRPYAAPASSSALTAIPYTVEVSCSRAGRLAGAHRETRLPLTRPALQQQPAHAQQAGPYCGIRSRRCRHAQLAPAAAAAPPLPPLLPPPPCALSAHAPPAPFPPPDSTAPSVIISQAERVPNRPAQLHVCLLEAGMHAPIHERGTSTISPALRQGHVSLPKCGAMLSLNPVQASPRGCHDDGAPPGCDAWVVVASGPAAPPAVRRRRLGQMQAAQGAAPQAVAATPHVVALGGEPAISGSAGGEGAARYWGSGGRGASWYGGGAARRAAGAGRHRFPSGPAHLDLQSWA